MTQPKPDWSNAWPVVGVAQGEPAPSAGVDAPRGEGFRVVLDVDPIPSDADAYQDHLNNHAAVRMFNELRIAYVASELAPDWPRFIRRSKSTVVVRELHVEYQSEGRMHERFVGATRWGAQRGSRDWSSSVWSKPRPDARSRAPGWCSCS